MELIIPQKSYQKMLQYAKAVESEISGLADVDWDEKHEKFTVGEVYLLKQEANNVNVAIVEGAADELMIELIQKGQIQSPRLWWHSHYNFEAFFSWVDQATLEERAKLSQTFYVAICINQMGHLKCDVVVNTPKKIIYRDIKIKIDTPIPQAIKDEVAQKVAPLADISLNEFAGEVKKIGGDWIKNILGDKDKTPEGESAVYDTFGRRYSNPMRQVMWLPWSANKALKVINKKDLVEEVDPYLHEWVFSSVDGKVYRVQKGSPAQRVLEDIYGR